MSDVQTVSALLDALAEFKGKVLTAQDKEDIAREYTALFDPIITAEEVATAFLDVLAKRIRREGRANVLHAREARLRTEREAELDAAKSNL